MGVTHFEQVQAVTSASVPTPTADGHASTKKYVDDQIITAKAYADTLNVANTAAEIVKKASVTLTAAQIKLLFTTPVELIPAPGAGKAISIQDVTFSLAFATAAYLNGGGGNVQIVQGAALLISAANLTTAVLLGTNANKSFVPTDNIALTANTAVNINKATANLTAGDSPITITVLYSIVSAV